MSEYLLPSGLYDLLPPEAAKQSYMLSTLLSRFVLMGYEQVIPPLLEYDETLLAGKGAARTAQTFRLADPLSQKMLGLRADITTQMARIAASRLVNAPKPLRLAYTGTVLRTLPSGLDSNRQLVQAGIECIGATGNETEVIATALEALAALGLNEVVVDLSLAGLLRAVLAEEGITDEAQIAQLRECVRSKDVAGLPTDLRCRGTLESLIHVTGDARTCLPRLQALPLPRVCLESLAHAAQVVEALHACAPHASVTVDLLDSRGFDYHQGLCFAFYLPSISQEIGRGGVYSIPLQDGSMMPATGMSLYVTRLLRAQLPHFSRPQRVYVPHGTPYEHSATVRAQGFSTVHGTEGADVSAQARALDCELCWTPQGVQAID